MLQPILRASARSLGHIERSLQFLRENNPAVDILQAHPLIGRRIEGVLRELIIPLGHTGYMALYRFVISRDEVRIPAIRHQRELGFQP